MVKRLTLAEVDEAERLYTVENLSFAKIGKRLGVSDVAIRNQLVKRNVAIRSLSESHRKIPCNHKYFGEPLDEDRAYWIGFLLADGGITEKKYGQTDRVTVRLAKVDLPHLEKLASALESEHKITTLSEEGSVQFSVSSSEIVDDLSRYKVIPRKSACHCFSDQIPDSLLRHYFRGYFDGNGGISQHSRSKWAINCAAGDHFLIAFRDWIASHLGGHPATISFRDGIHRMAWSGTHRCREILDLMYADATVFLDRKMEKYNQIVKDADFSPRKSYNRR